MPAPDIHNIQTLQDLVDLFAARGDSDALHIFTAADDASSRHAASRADIVTYAALHEAIERVAEGLRSKGIAAGDMVLLCGPNGLGWVAAYFGIVCAGAVAVPIDDQATKDMLVAVLRHSEAKFAITTSRRVAELRDTAVALLHYALLDGDRADPLSWTQLGGSNGMTPPIGADGLERRGTVEPAQTASLLFTSGTTGSPKAVPLTHGNLAVNAGALMSEDLIRRTDRVLMPLPMHHTYPFTLGLLTTLGVGATIVMPSGVTGPEITGAAKAAVATAMLGVPSLYEAVWQGIEARVKAGGRNKVRLFRGLLALSRNIRRFTRLSAGKLLFRQLHAAVGPKLQVLGCGGAKLDPGLARNLESVGWTVLTGYGLTETSPVLTFNSRSRRRLGSEGRALPGVEVRIEKGPDDAHGQILARGPNVFDGYWKNTDATRDAFTDDGWFRTGDLGSIDSDGYLRIVGRLKEVIVLADGKNVFPEDVEPAYSASPLLKEMAILERNGSLVALVVPDDDEVRRRGGLGAVRLLKDELERIALQMPPYQRIIDFRAVREDLPRTRLGKIKRHLLPQLYERAGKRSLEDEPVVLSDADQALIASSATTTAVWSWLQERYPDRHLHLDMSPQLDLQIDSLGWVSMTLELEHRFGFSLPGSALSRVMSLRDLLIEVERAPSPDASGLREPIAATPAPAPPGPILRALGAMLYGLNRLAIRSCFRLKVSGAEKLPRDACLAITPNHLSYLDPLAVAAALPNRVLEKTHWAGWVGKMYAGPVSTLVSRATRVFPVDPDQDLMGAIGTARSLLEARESVVWFPEGRRSPTGVLRPFRPGIGVLLKDTECLVVPAHVSGTYGAWPMGQRFPRPGGLLTVIFGEAVEVGRLIEEGDGESEEIRIRDALERRVAALDDTSASSRSPMDSDTLSGARVSRVETDGDH